MPTPQVPASNDRYIAVTVLLEAIGAAKSRFCVCPVRGNVVWIGSALDVVVDGDNILTFKINGVLITGSTMTHDVATTAAGQVKQSKPTALTAVNRGDALEALTDGGGTVGQCRVTYLIEQS